MEDPVSGLAESDALQATLEDVRKKLANAKIDYSEWGQGKSKPIKDLAGEIQNGETELVVDDSGDLLRRVNVAVVNVFTDIDGKRYQLKEARQEFINERGQVTRVRKREPLGSVNEKMYSGEGVDVALRRAVSEELGQITKEHYSGREDWIDNLVFKNKRNESERKNAESYPGLEAEYNVHYADVILPEDVAKNFKNGISENDGKKITYFEWVEVS